MCRTSKDVERRCAAENSLPLFVEFSFNSCCFLCLAAIHFSTELMNFFVGFVKCPHVVVHFLEATLVLLKEHTVRGAGRC